MVKQRTQIQNLRRTQLDSIYQSINPFIGKIAACSGSWIKEVRNALGISSTQFAKLLGISSPAFIKLEANEEKQSIELQTLRRVAAAIQCQLVYAIVPDQNYGSLDSILRKRANDVATQIVERVAKTMSLEDQAVREKELNRQIQELADELIRDIDKRLWEKG